MRKKTRSSAAERHAPTPCAPARCRCLTIELRETEIDAVVRCGFLKTGVRNDLRSIEMPKTKKNAARAGE
jgi:hypothetical protein